MRLSAANEKLESALAAAEDAIAVEAARAAAAEEKSKNSPWWRFGF